jgi:hypothetical protein
MTNWEFYDLTTPIGRLEVATWQGGQKWFAHLLAGEVKCLICGEPCALAGEHAPVLYGNAELENDAEYERLLFISMCLTCGRNFEHFEAAAHRMVEAVEVAALTRGRSFGPVLSAPEAR